MKKIVFYLAILLTLYLQAQTAPNKNQPFRAADYPRSEFRVTRSAYQIGDVRIGITQAKRRKQSPMPPSFCRAWVDIGQGEHLIRRIYYGDFEPVGYKFGIFVPSRQPSADYFVFVKEGDYDGRLFLVDASGHVTNLLGGLFFIASSRFLVSQYSSDEAGLAVFDLQAHKLVFKTTDIPYIQNWYKDAGGYFFTESEWRGKSGAPTEKERAAYRLDFHKGEVLKVDMSPSKLHSAASRGSFKIPSFTPSFSSQAASTAAAIAGILAAGM